MTLTGQQRSRAARLRAKLARGGALSPEEQTWLDAYPARAASTRPAPATAPAPTPAPTPAPAPAPAPAPPPPADAPKAPPQPAQSATTSSAAPTAAEANFRVLDFADSSGAAPPAAAAPAAAVCGCSRCKRRAAVVVRCLVDGAEVHPPLTEDGARGYAEGLLQLLAFGARVFRGRTVKPEVHEVRALARALVAMSERRDSMSWLGAWDDLSAFAIIVLSFVARAWNAPALPAPAS